MPIPLGVLAVAGAGAGGGSSFTLLQTVTSSGSSFSLSFSSIPQTYKHLQIRYVAKTTDSSNDDFALEIDPYTAGSFSRHILTGNGSSVTSGASTSQDFINVVDGVALSTTANAFSAGVIDILDYSVTTKSKTVRILQGHAANVNRIQLHSGRSGSTNAITAIGMTLFAGNFAAGSRFSLYGIS
jgi:hypothetical protein